MSELIGCFVQTLVDKAGLVGNVELKHASCVFCRLDKVVNALDFAGSEGLDLAGMIDRFNGD